MSWRFLSKMCPSFLWKLRVCNLFQIHELSSATQRRGNVSLENVRRLSVPAEDLFFCPLAGCMPAFVLTLDMERLAYSTGRCETEVRLRLIMKVANIYISNELLLTAGAKGAWCFFCHMLGWELKKIGNVWHTVKWFMEVQAESTPRSRGGMKGWTTLKQEFHIWYIFTLDQYNYAYRERCKETWPNIALSAPGNNVTP